MDPSLYTKINALKIEKRRSASSPLGKLSALRSHPHTHITRALPSSLQFTGSRSKVLNDLSTLGSRALRPQRRGEGSREKGDKVGKLLKNHRWAKLSLSVLFTHPLASSSAHPANSEPHSGDGVRKENGASPRWLGSVCHTPASCHTQGSPPSHAGPTHPDAAFAMPSHPPERMQAGLMTEELSGSPRSRLWRAEGEVIGIAGHRSRK